MKETALRELFILGSISSEGEEMAMGNTIPRVSHGVRFGLLIERDSGDSR